MNTGSMDLVCRRICLDTRGDSNSLKGICIYTRRCENPLVAGDISILGIPSNDKFWMTEAQKKTNNFSCISLSLVPFAGEPIPLKLAIVRIR